MERMTDSIAAYLEMGGYGPYVWSALAVAALVMVVLLVRSLRTLRARRETLESLQRGGDEPPPGP